MLAPKLNISIKLNEMSNINIDVHSHDFRGGPRIPKAFEGPANIGTSTIKIVIVS